MDKPRYEYLKSLRLKAANGTATFAERNILNMENKKARKAARRSAYELQMKEAQHTRSTKRFNNT